MSSLIKPLFRLMVVTFIFAMLMPVTTTRANPDCNDPKHAGNPNCPPPDEPPPSITYTAALTGSVFQFGSPVPVTPNVKGGALFPDPNLPLTFTRPSATDAQLVWEAVFDACENFFGPFPIVGSPRDVGSNFTATAGNWLIDQAGGVRLALGIQFDINGISPPAEGELYFSVTLQLIGNTFFDNPNDSFLPVLGVTNPVEYEMVEFWITGGTAKRVKPRYGCVSGGSAPITAFDPAFVSTLEITAN